MTASIAIVKLEAETVKAALSSVMDRGRTFLDNETTRP